MIQHNHIRAWPAAGPSPAQGTKAGTGCKLLLLHPVHRSLQSTLYSLYTGELQPGLATNHQGDCLQMTRS